MILKMGIPFYFHYFYELKALLELVLLVNKNRIESKVNKNKNIENRKAMTNFISFVNE